MAEQLSTFQMISLVAWVLIIFYFAPKVYRTWQGRRQDWMEVGWLLGAAIMVATILLRPEWTTDVSTLVFFPLIVLALLERRSRKE